MRTRYFGHNHDRLPTRISLNKNFGLRLYPTQIKPHNNISMLIFPTFEIGIELSHHIFDLFHSHILPRLPVYLIGELGAMLDHLLHCHVLREPTVLVAPDTIILIAITVSVRSLTVVSQRHTATLTKFLFHIVFYFRSPVENFIRFQAQDIQVIFCYNTKLRKKNSTTKKRVETYSTLSFW